MSRVRTPAVIPSLLTLSIDSIAEHERSVESFAELPPDVAQAVLDRIVARHAQRAEAQLFTGRKSCARSHSRARSGSNASTSSRGSASASDTDGAGAANIAVPLLPDATLAKFVGARLSRVSVPGQSAVSGDTLVELVHACGAALEELDVSHCARLDDPAQCVRMFAASARPALRVVNVSGCTHAVDDSVVRALASSGAGDTLERVEMEDCFLVSADALLHLCASAPALRVLAVSHMVLGDVAVSRVLAMLPHLERLAVNHVASLSVAAFATTAEPALGVLTTLHVAGCPTVDDRLLEWISTAVPTLCALDVSECRVTDAGLAALAACTHLHTLALDRCRSISDEGVGAWVTAQERAASDGVCPLESISLRGCRQLSGHALYTLGAHCPRLHSVSLCGVINLAEEAVLSLVQQLPCLHSLDVGYCAAVTDHTLRTVARVCPALRALGVAGCDKVGVGALNMVLRACTELRELNVYGCLNVSSSFLRQCTSQHPELEVLASAWGW